MRFQVKVNAEMKLTSGIRLHHVYFLFVFFCFVFILAFSLAFSVICEYAIACSCKRYPLRQAMAKRPGNKSDTHTLIALAF